MIEPNELRRLSRNLINADCCITNADFLELGCVASDTDKHDEVSVHCLKLRNLLNMVVDLAYATNKAADTIEALQAERDIALTALRKIYTYRSDEPDWNMVMAIAGDIVEPMVATVT